MKHTILGSIRFVTPLALLTGFLPLQASEPIEVPWNEVCRIANGRQLAISTVNGNIVKGYCTSINVNEIVVKTEDQRVISIARAALSRLQMRRSRGHQVGSLRRGLRKGLQQGSDWLLTPYAFLGIVVIPGSMAWVAVSAPFCLLGELKDKLTGEQEIKVI